MKIKLVQFLLSTQARDTGFFRNSLPLTEPSKTLTRLRTHANSVELSIFYGPLYSHVQSQYLMGNLIENHIQKRIKSPRSSILTFLNELKTFSDLISANIITVDHNENYHLTIELHGAWDRGLGHD